MLRKRIKYALKKANADHVMVRFLLPFHHQISDMTAEKARCLLQEYSPKPEGSHITKNNMASELIDLQIIVPAYNADKYLRECIESALSQKTKYSYKVVVVDDGSTDNTKAIIESYVHDERIIPIFQENAGFSGARNSGLKNIFARYIMFLDSDDTLAENAIESLLNVAFEVNADIVEGSAYTLKNNECVVYDKYKERKDNYIGRLKGQPWGKVYRSSIFENLCFPDGFWFEDSINALFVYPQARSISVIPNYVYKYRINQEGISITAHKHKKVIDTYWVTELLVQSYLASNGVIDEEYIKTIMQQAILNYRRTDMLKSELQEAIFVLTSELVKSCGGGIVSRRFTEIYTMLLQGKITAYTNYVCHIILYKTYGVSLYSGEVAV